VAIVRWANRSIYPDQGQGTPPKLLGCRVPSKTIWHLNHRVYVTFPFMCGDCTLGEPISRSGSRNTTKTFGLPRPVKDDLAHKSPGICDISLHVWRLYVGRTDLYIQIRVKEHHRNVRLHQSEKSDVAEHSIDLRRRPMPSNTSVLARISMRLAWLMRGAVEIELRSTA